MFGHEPVRNFIHFSFHQNRQGTKRRQNTWPTYQKFLSPKNVFVTVDPFLHIKEKRTLENNNFSLVGVVIQMCWGYGFFNFDNYQRCFLL